jgi:hypothetical protein
MALKFTLDSRVNDVNERGSSTRADQYVHGVLYVSDVIDSPAEFARLRAPLHGVASHRRGLSAAAADERRPQPPPS